MAPKRFIDPDWRPVFLAKGMDHLDAWWRLADEGRRQATLMDDPNRRYGGEMRVYRIRVLDVDGQPRHLYVKCQREQKRRTAAHPLHGEPTLFTEFRALRRCLNDGIPVARPVFFDTRIGGDRRRYTVMVSQGLDGFHGLDEIDPAALALTRRRRLIRDVADTLRLLHATGYVHRTLYPKHIFVAWRPDLDRYDVRFIDLEKTHRAAGFRHLYRDLESLARRSEGFSGPDRLRFLKRYLGPRPLGRDGKALARRLAAERR